jgi:hypothetical protein
MSRVAILLGGTVVWLLGAASRAPCQLEPEAFSLHEFSKLARDRIRKK